MEAYEYEVATYGCFEYIPDGLVPEAQIDINVTPIDLTMHWQRCSLLSDMVAGYIACAYPDGFKGSKSLIYSSISTIFQELIENAARYSRQREGMVTIRVSHYNRVVRIEVQNDTMPGAGQQFESHLRRLFEASNLEDLYMSIIESHASESYQSGIGLLLLLKDYPVKLGARILKNATAQDTIIVRAFYHMELSDYEMSDAEAISQGSAPAPR